MADHRAPPRSMASRRLRRRLGCKAPSRQRVPYPGSQRIGCTPGTAPASHNGWKRLVELLPPCHTGRRQRRMAAVRLAESGRRLASMARASGAGEASLPRPFRLLRFEQLENPVFRPRGDAQLLVALANLRVIGRTWGRVAIQNSSV